MEPFTECLFHYSRAGGNPTGRELRDFLAQKLAYDKAANKSWS